MSNETIEFKAHPHEDMFEIGDDIIILDRQGSQVYSTLRNKYLKYDGNAWVNTEAQILCVCKPVEPVQDGPNIVPVSYFSTYVNEAGLGEGGHDKKYTYMSIQVICLRSFKLVVEHPKVIKAVVYHMFPYGYLLVHTASKLKVFYLYDGDIKYATKSRVCNAKLATYGVVNLDNKFLTLGKWTLEDTYEILNTSGASCVVDSEGNVVIKRDTQAGVLSTIGDIIRENLLLYGILIGVLIPLSLDAILGS